MHIPRIYLNQNITLNQALELPKETAIHVVTVLKRRVGQNVILFNNIPDHNGKLGEYSAEIITAAKNNVTVKITEYIIKNTKSKIPIELAQCISKPNHFDVTLQKSVELGVYTITPIISERSEVLRKESFDTKLERWQKIVISACEQCGRTDLPVLNKPIKIQDWVAQNQTDKQLLLTLCTKTNNTLHDLKIDLNNLEGAKIIIGPEGGLSNSETELLAKNKFSLIKLGHRILRTETAGIAALSIIQYIFEEI